ncbi:MAG: hypothetical protein LC117_04315 [Bacteroidia bacterium]|nr:hypothetical protein [Bacteroidia bacterium]MCZ2277133.1 hypothetical protein [Bacteroidia bacterium]
MSLHFLEHHEIDKLRWDQTINQSPAGLIYGYSWFLDIAAPGWCAIVENDYSAIMPLPMRKKWGFAYIYPPFFIQQLGVFSLGGSVPHSTTKKFFNTIPERFRFIEMYLNEYCNAKEVDGDRMQVSKRFNQVLLLNNKYDKIASVYSTQLKRNLRKAATANTTFRSVENFKQIIGIYRKHQAARSNYSTLDYKRFYRLIEECKKREMAMVIGGFDEENIMHTGAIFLKSHNRLIFIFSGSDEYGRKHSLLARLFNQLIESKAGSELILDFEGSMDKNLARFYKSFGSLETVYLQIKINRLPFVVKWLK